MPFVHAQAPIGTHGEFRIVGDEQNGGAALAGQCKHQLDDMRTGFLIEIAGWLVGEEKLGITHHGAGETDTLLLSP